MEAVTGKGIRNFKRERRVTNPKARELQPIVNVWVPAAVRPSFSAPNQPERKPSNKTSWQRISVNFENMLIFSVYK